VTARKCKIARKIEEMLLIGFSSSSERKSEDLCPITLVISVPFQGYPGGRKAFHDS
jgi:hypothetical protein